MPATLRVHFDSTRAYLYIWISKCHSIAYVGQTNAEEGALGRSAQHVGMSGALRRSFEHETGLRLEEINDLLCISYSLPPSREFTSTESSYREAVEYLVQTRILDIRADLDPPIRPVSNVRYSERTALRSVRDSAEEIIASFKSTYSRIDDFSKQFKI
jgi:hypothetical protein